MSTYHYSKNTFLNLLPYSRRVNAYYTIYNTRDDNVIYVWSKEYWKHIQFQRDHKFNLYYMGISEVDMDKYCYPNTVKQALECTSIVVYRLLSRTTTRTYLDIDLLFMNKIPILLMISRNIEFVRLKALLSKHNKRVQNRLQQIVQSRGFKAVSTFVDGAFKNIVDWVQSNLHLDLTNHKVDSHVPIPEDIIQVVNNMGKQEVTPDGIQFRNIHHESILLDIFVDNDLYDDNNCASDADWKIEKKPKTDLKKIELNVDKPDTDLKKIEFCTNIDIDEIDNLNNKETVHLNDDLV